MTELVSTELVATLVLLTIALVALLDARPSLARTPGGKLSTCFARSCSRSQALVVGFAS
jgi:hypothetical protein